MKKIEAFENLPENEKNAHLVALFKKNIKVEESFELVDLCPLYFSKSELLDQLDDDWFQKTGIVHFFYLPNSFYPFLNIGIFPKRW